MFLKRIEIYGFKSFAGRSVLDFEYTKSGNITAVVGPNGSGKSNVADAIRWVTGEQSSKNLRSKKSEDVIFCGSTAKPKSSYAEVSLLLSSDVPVTFEFNNKEQELTEIQVSRKLYRSGESEYLINNKKVRLTDINQLLASLGFGQSSYTVIGQGMVDRLLFFTASERKVLFDEAAGVKQYEIKREQSIRKLESTDANLIRLKDILSELEPRVVNLRRLVKRAEGRKEYEVELSETQQKYFGSLLSEYQAKVRGSEEKKEFLNKKIVQIDSKIIDIQTRLDSATQNPHTAERRAQEQQISTCTEERDGLMREVSYLKGQVESQSRNLTLITNKKKELTAEKDSLSSKVDFLKEKISTEQSMLDAAAKLKAKAEVPVSEAQNKLQLLEKEMREPIVDQSAHIEKLRRELHTLSKNKLAAEQASSRLVELSKQEATLLSEIKEASDGQSKAQREAEVLQKRLDSLELEVSKLASLVNPVTLSKLEESMKELEDIRPNAEGFTDKLKRIFTRFREISKAINNDEREKLELEISKLKRDYKEASDRLISCRVLLGTKESRLASVQADIAQNKERLLPDVTDNAEIEKLEQEIARHEGTVSERQNVLLRQKDELMRKLADGRDALHQAEMEYSRLTTLVANQQHELESAERRLGTVIESLQGVVSEDVENDTAVTAKLNKLEKELDKKEEDLAKYRGGLSQLVAKERELEQANLTSEREKRVLQDEKAALQAQLSALEVETARTQVRLEDLNEEIRLAGLTISASNDDSYLDQMEKDVLKLKMENLRRKLDTIGGVDPETETEYAELEARASEMSVQVADLTQAKADLEKVVTELDERIKHQFADVFKNISSEFSRYFSLLFGGGSAKLELGEDSDGNFGIEISANPPGKRVQSLNSLSGGERTLTSLALLFAILSVNPSPFCVLDEVDAALDESNTLRFIKILSDLAKKTQFIIISHNRDTMNVASSLYGVTMNDEHVSKLLSVKLTDALVSAKIV